MEPISQLISLGVSIAGVVIKEALQGAQSVEEALARLQEIDARLPSTLAEMRTRLATNDAAEDARRAAGTPPVV